ncbi:phage head spike fiber domain-containing protein [Flectobacillus roseus]|uniref:Uncharacterized protein n=1 Tax=Flectobacillus roseus TaxID=502259 RepID=A0ABT6Y7S5_9BACT|nr:hypothetical protein [Flectobacillus roseus]MDI9859620.1 hypothetical protein [Flectobacillus roseus]
MAQTLTVKPQYVNTAQVFIDGKSVLLNNNLTQEQLLAIWQRAEFRSFIDITYTNVADSFPENFEIDPNLFHAYDSGEVSHNPAKTDYPANSVGKQLNEIISRTGLLERKYTRPQAFPVLNLAFAYANSLDAGHSFQRNSQATYIGKDGKVRIAKANVPRFTYDSGSLEPLGLLLEGARTNYLTNSVQLNLFSKGANVVYSGKTTLLGFEAHTFTSTSVVDSWVTQYAPLTPNKVYIFSYFSSHPTAGPIFLRKAGDIPTRSVNNFVSTLVATGVYKHKVVFTTTSEETIGYFSVIPANLVAVVTSSMPQLEDGEVDTSFIPTYSTPVTRAADYFRIDETLFQKQVGTLKDLSLLIETSLAFANSGESNVLELRAPDTSGGWNVSRVIVREKTITLNTINDGVNQFSKSSGILAQNTNHKIGVSLSSSEANLVINGVLAGTQSSVINIPNPTRLLLLTEHVVRIKSLQVFDIKLSTELLLIQTNSESKAPHYSDFNGAAFLSVEAILRKTCRQEFSVDGTGAAVTRNIRRGYDFTFEIVDSSGVTITAQPASSCTAGTDNALTFTAPLGKTLTYAITPVFEY